MGYSLWPRDTRYSLWPRDTQGSSTLPRSARPLAQGSGQIRCTQAHEPIPPYTTPAPHASIKAPNFTGGHWPARAPYVAARRASVQGAAAPLHTAATQRPAYGTATAFLNRGLNFTQGRCSGPSGTPMHGHQVCTSSSKTRQTERPRVVAAPAWAHAGQAAGPLRHVCTLASASTAVMTRPSARSGAAPPGAASSSGPRTFSSAPAAHAWACAHARGDSTGSKHGHELPGVASGPLGGRPALLGRTAGARGRARRPGPGWPAGWRSRATGSAVRLPPTRTRTSCARCSRRRTSATRHHTCRQSCPVWSGAAVLLVKSRNAIVT